jgi:hypothetical protein
MFPFQRASRSVSTPSRPLPYLATSAVSRPIIRVGDLHHIIIPCGTPINTSRLNVRSVLRTNRGAWVPCIGMALPSCAASISASLFFETLSLSADPQRLGVDEVDPQLLLRQCSSLQECARKNGGTNAKQFRARRASAQTRKLLTGSTRGSCSRPALPRPACLRASAAFRAQPHRWRARADRRRCRRDSTSRCDWCRMTASHFPAPC